MRHKNGRQGVEMETKSSSNSFCVRPLQMIRTASTEPRTSRTDFYLYDNTVDAFISLFFDWYFGEVTGSILRISEIILWSLQCKSFSVKMQIIKSSKLCIDSIEI